MANKKSMLGIDINDAEFFVFDVETTGYGPKNGGEMIEIGAAKVVGGAIVETFSSLIQPTVPVGYYAFRVHGISDEMLADAPSFPDIAARLHTLTTDTFLAAYNAPFDMGFLLMHMERCNYTLQHHNVVDVLPLARKLIPKLPSYKLESSAAALNIPFPVKHRALEDAVVTAQLLIEFCRITKEQGGKTVADLIRQKKYSAVAIELAAAIETALTNNKKLSFHYESANTGKVSNRIVTPKEFEPPFLIAFCHKANENRTFRVDRISELVLIEE